MSGLPENNAILTNGLKAAFRSRPHLHQATVVIAVKVGSRYESASNNGLSHFLEHMLFRGAGSYPNAYALNRAIESLGGDLNAATYADFTTYMCTVPPSELAHALPILGQFISAPRFNDIDVERRIVREELLDALSESGEVICPDDLLSKLMFDEHPLGRPIGGTIENVARFAKSDLQQHLNRFYCAQNTTLGIAGPISANQLQPIIEDHFGSMAPGTSAPSLTKPAQTKARRIQHQNESGSQTQVRVALPTVGELDSTWPALRLLEGILDDGMSTRLHRHLVDDAGLAYDVSADLSGYEECGVLEVAGSASNENLPLFVDAILALLENLNRNPVRAEEFEIAKKRRLFGLQVASDDTEDVATSAALSLLFKRNLEADALSRKTENVKFDQIAEITKKTIVGDALHLVTVGPTDEKRREEVDAIAQSWHPES